MTLTDFSSRTADVAKSAITTLSLGLACRIVAASLPPARKSAVHGYPIVATGLVKLPEAGLGDRSDKRRGDAERTCAPLRRRSSAFALEPTGH